MGVVSKALAGRWDVQRECSSAAPINLIKVRNLITPQWLCRPVARAEGVCFIWFRPILPVDHQMELGNEARRLVQTCLA